MRKCVFIGPSGFGLELPNGIDFFEPAAQGAVFRAVEEGYQLIGIVDGYFGTVPSVWHKEILYALSQGVTVLGAASMGALRAAELWRYGMTGIGVVYRLFRCGALTDDDEVCVLHAPMKFSFQPMSYAMVDLRYTMRLLQRSGILTRSVADSVCRFMKQRHFSERTIDSLEEFCRSSYGEREGPRVANQICANVVGYKQRDARSLLDTAIAYSEPPPVISWNFPRTTHFTRQFVVELEDVPQSARHVVP